MEFDRPLILCAYQPLQDFGFALPLYKSSLSSNAWYVHLATKPFDLSSPIASFELFHPESPSEIGEPHQLLRVGDQARIVFLWNARVYVDNVDEVLKHIDKRNELEIYAPVTLTDLLLYSRSSRFGAGVKRSYRYIRQQFGHNAAERWLANILIKQALNIDLDRIIDFASDQDFKGSEILATALSRVQVIEPHGNKIVLSYPDTLNAILGLQEIEFNRLNFTLQACRAAGKELELRSRAYVVRSADSITPDTVRGKPANPSVSPSGHRARSQGNVSKTLQIEVSGQGMDVGESLRRTLTITITETLKKFGLKTGKVSALFSKGPQGRGFVCLLRFSRHGIAIVAHGESPDTQIAMNEALKHARSQLRKALGQKRLDRRRSLDIKEALHVDTDRNRQENEHDGPNLE